MNSFKILIEKNLQEWQLAKRKYVHEKQEYKWHRHSCNFAQWKSLSKLEK